MVTILLTTLKVIPLALIIVFIVQTVRLALFANTNDVSRPSLLSSVALVAFMPLTTEGATGMRELFRYYGELITGVMYSKYKAHVTHTVTTHNEIAALEPETRSYIISSFTIPLVTYSLERSTDFEMFARSTQNAMAFLYLLVNKDLSKIIHQRLNDCEREFEPYIHKLLTHINETARINNVSTDAVIYTTLEYLNRVDLRTLYANK